MDAQTKADRMGMTLQAVHQRVKKNPNWEGAKKVGRRLIFPDDPETTTTIAEPNEFPPEEESKRKKAFYDAEGSKQDAIKKTKLNQAALGELVNRKELEDEFKKTFTAIRTKVLALPVKLKRIVGDDLSDRAEDALEQEVIDLLNEVADGAAK